METMREKVKHTKIKWCKKTMGIFNRIHTYRHLVSRTEHFHCEHLHRRSLQNPQNLKLKKFHEISVKEC